MKKHFSKIVIFALIAVIVLSFLSNFTFKHDVDISTYGVLFRVGDGEWYEIRHVNISGTLYRRFSEHGFGRGSFSGYFSIEGFSFVGDCYNYIVTFTSTAHSQGGAFLVSRQNASRGIHGVAISHLEAYGWIDFINSLERFALKLFEQNPQLDDENNLIRDSLFFNGLVFVSPASDLSTAKAIYSSFFDW